MTFTLPSNPEAEAAKRARIWAEERILLSNNFDQSVLAQYENQYREWWSIDRPDYTIDDINAGLAQLGIAAVQILTKAGQYIMAVEASAPGSVPERLLSAPYEYRIDNIEYQSGHTEETLPDLMALWGLAQTHGMPVKATIVALSLKSAWGGESEPEEEEEPIDE